MASLENIGLLDGEKYVNIVEKFTSYKVERNFMNMPDGKKVQVDRSYFIMLAM